MPLGRPLKWIWPTVIQTRDGRSVWPWIFTGGLSREEMQQPYKGKERDGWHIDLAAGIGADYIHVFVRRHAVALVNV